MNGTILIYGATGYTGRLIAMTASERGARPILAGRNLDKVKRVAEPLGLSARAFDLGDPARVDTAIKDISVVLRRRSVLRDVSASGGCLSSQSRSLPRHYRGN